MKISFISIDKIGQPEVDMVAKRLPLRYQRALKFRQQSDFLLSIAAGILLLQEFPNCIESEIFYNSAGKPSLPSVPCFNLSHGGQYAVIAISPYSVGIDVEKVSTFDSNILSSVFQQEEIQWINEKDSDKRFFRLWTLKEAVLKSLGCGLYVEPSSFSALPAVSHDKVYLMDKTFQVYCHEVDSHLISVAEIIEN